MFEWHTLKKPEENTLGKKTKNNLYSHEGFHRIFKESDQLQFWRSQLNTEEKKKETAGDATYIMES